MIPIGQVWKVEIQLDKDQLLMTEEKLSFVLEVDQCQRIMIPREYLKLLYEEEIPSFIAFHIGVSKKGFRLQHGDYFHNEYDGGNDEGKYDFATFLDPANDPEGTPYIPPYYVELGEFNVGDKFELKIGGERIRLIKLGDDD